MLKALLALLVAAAAIALPQDSARAQGCGPQNPNCIVPTAPPGTSTNQAASTAFVQQEIAGGGNLPLASGKIYIGSLAGIATAQALSGAGDCTVSLATNGVASFTCTKTNGASFGTMAVQNANAVAITGGSITGMPSPANPSDVATKNYVDGLTTSVFTSDNPPNPGTAGSVPAPPSGATAANAVMGAGGSWTPRKPLLGFVVPTPLQSIGGMTSNFVTAPTPMANLGTSGPGSTTMTTSPSDVFAQLGRSLGVSNAYAYVDPVNGTDTGSTCPQSAPCKTLQFCMTNCTPLNIVGIPTGPFTPFTFDSATAATRVHRLTFSGPASIRLNASPYIDPSAMTFTATATPSVYSATLSLTGSQAVQRVAKNNVYDTGNGNLFRLQKYSSLAALQAASGANPSGVQGWFYGAGVLSIAYFGSNINVAKATFNAYYLDTTGDSCVIVNNNAYLLIDAVYQLDLDGTCVHGVSSTTNYPTVLIEGRGNVRSFVAPGHAFSVVGGFFYASGVDCQAPQFDCFNFDAAASGAKTMAIGHNIKGWYAGDLETFPLGGGGTPISNGWSAHGGVNDIIAGASFGQNYGPNIANTVAGTFTDATWLVGVETTASTGGANNSGIGIFGDNALPSASRTAWIDTCSTLSEAVGLFVSLPNATIKYSNCSMNVPPTIQSGGVLTTYVRNAP